MPEDHTYYDENYQFTKDEGDAIIRTTSYHRKDLELSAIWFPDHEHQGVRASISTSFQRPSSANPGAFGLLPQELLDKIFLNLDIHSVTKCRQASVQLRQAVDCLPEYQLLTTHALNALCALLRTRLARNVTLSDFYEALCTSTCGHCSGFAMFIFLPTWRRCCLICLRLRAEKVQMQTIASIREQLFLNMADISKLTSFKTLPGTYSMGEYVQKDRITIAHVEQALRVFQEQKQTEPPRFRHDGKLAFMASCALPYYDKESKTIEYGISCAGVQVAIDRGFDSAMATKFTYMARDIVYSKAGFLQHFKDCCDAQVLWESSKGGSIEPPELSQMVKNDDKFKPRE